MSKLSLLHTTLGIVVTQDSGVARLIYEAHRLGIKVGIYTDKNSKTIHNADFCVMGPLNDQNQLKKFATQCQFVVYTDGSRITDSLVSYLQQFTKVPQGFDALDLINDRSIQRVILNMLHINSLPYQTVFSLNDVRQALNHLQLPVYLRPVQTSYVEQPPILITNPKQLMLIRSIFNGDAYLLESLPPKSRYFNLTVAKSKQNTVTFPVIEEHYQGNQLNFANLNPKLPLSITDQFTQIALKIANHLNCVEVLSISLVLTNDGRIYVDDISLPFKLINNVYNLTSDNVYQTFLRSVMNLPVRLGSLHKIWLIKVINQSNLRKLKDLWINRGSIMLDLSASINNYHPKGYGLVSAKSLDDARAKFQEA